MLLGAGSERQRFPKPDPETRLAHHNVRYERLEAL
jgi:hypothetical protein